MAPSLCLSKLYVNAVGVVAGLLQGFCLSAMVDILCAVLSGGQWGPTVDGFTINKLQACMGGAGAAAAEAGGGESRTAGGTDSNSTPGEQPQQREGAQGAEEEEEEEEAPATGIGHFFGALRIDGFRNPCAFKRTIDDWISAFRACPPVVDGRPVLIPGDPEWAQMESRGKKGVPVKMAVVADLVDISQRLGVPLPFDQKVDVSGIRRVKATTNLSTEEKERNATSDR
eukprot:SAG25_NODE_3397_length_1096_cov_1.259779_2_plen_228_part_00